MEEFSYKSKSESKKQVQIRHDLNKEAEEIQKAAVEAELWLTQSPEFTPEKYNYKKNEDNTEIFRAWDLTLDQAKKVDSFEFVSRYQRYFS